jgi:hypothetical protein
VRTGIDEAPKEVFDDTDPKKQTAVTTRQEIMQIIVPCEEILKEFKRSLSRLTSVDHFSKCFARTCSSPTAQLDNGDANPDESPPVQENTPLP